MRACVVRQNVKKRPVIKDGEGQGDVEKEPVNGPGTSCRGGGWKSKEVTIKNEKMLG